MSLEIVTEIWNELKTHLTPPDRSFAADNVVAILIDHDYDASDIKEYFAGDSYIKEALEPYLDADGESEEEEEEEYFETDDADEDY